MEPIKARWFEQPFWVFLLILFVFPIGVYLLITSKHIRFGTKIMIALGSLFIWILAIKTSGDKGSNYSNSGGGNYAYNTQAASPDSVTHTESGVKPIKTHLEKLQETIKLIKSPDYFPKDYSEEGDISIAFDKFCSISKLIDETSTMKLIDGTSVINDDGVKKAIASLKQLLEYTQAREYPKIRRGHN